MPTNEEIFEAIKLQAIETAWGWINKPGLSSSLITRKAHQDWKKYLHPAAETLLTAIKPDRSTWDE